MATYYVRNTGGSPPYFDRLYKALDYASSNDTIEILTYGPQAEYGYFTYRETVAKNWSTKSNITIKNTGSNRAIFVGYTTGYVGHNWTIGNDWKIGTTGSGQIIFAASLGSVSSLIIPNGYRVTCGSKFVVYELGGSYTGYFLDFVGGSGGYTNSLSGVTTYSGSSGVSLARIRGASVNMQITGCNIAGNMLSVTDNSSGTITLARNTVDSGTVLGITPTKTLTGSVLVALNRVWGSGGAILSGATGTCTAALHRNTVVGAGNLIKANCTGLSGTVVGNYAQSTYLSGVGSKNAYGTSLGGASVWVNTVSVPTDADAGFVNYATGDVHLLDDSLLRCQSVDIGSVLGSATDFYGSPILNGGDIGCAENQNACPLAGGMHRGDPRIIRHIRFARSSYGRRITYRSV